MQKYFVILGFALAHTGRQLPANVHRGADSERIYRYSKSDNKRGGNSRDRLRNVGRHSDTVRDCCRDNEQEIIVLHDDIHELIEEHEDLVSLINRKLEDLDDVKALTDYLDGQLEQGRHA